MARSLVGPPLPAPAASGVGAARGRLLRQMTLVMFLSTACAPRPWAGGLTPAPGPTATLRALPTPTAPPSVGDVEAATPIADAADSTPMAAPTATPVSYSVKPGDTLIGIAARYGITLEALEAMNLGIDPRNLQPGQTLIIPSPPPSGEAAPGNAPAPTRLSLTVRPFDCYPSAAGSLICLTEFVNTTPDPIVGLAVLATLPGGESGAGNTATAYSPLDLIPPGMAVPLAVVFGQPPAGDARRAAALVIAAESAGELADGYITFAVRETTGAPTPAGFTIGGRLANPSAAELRSLTLVATVYNSAGAVLGYRKTSLADLLAASADLIFSIELPGVRDAERWAVIAQGRTR